jgi:hypothetical protein
MASLKSVYDVPGVNYYDNRDNLYYNKYEYRARFALEGIRYTWYAKTPEELQKRVDGGKGYYGIRDQDRTIVDANLEILKDFITWRNDRKKDKTAMIRIEGDIIAAYSNDLQLLNTLQELDRSLLLEYTQVQTSKFLGVKYFVNEPNHPYRVYLKSKRVSDIFSNELNNLFSRSTSLHPSPALKHWAKTPYDSYAWRQRWTSSSHFIDYDDESVLSYLALIHGDMLGKRYKLEKRPEAI